MPRSSQIHYRTFSSAETKRHGTRLARTLCLRKHALVITLSGELGSGKTTFTQGFAAGLGIKRCITSPTFVLMQRYALKKHSFAPLDSKTSGFKNKGKKKDSSSFGRYSSMRGENLTGFKNFYHIDCYRIKKAEEFSKFGLKQILENSENVVLIEWPERIKKTLPRGFMTIAFRHGKKENERLISF